MTSRFRIPALRLPLCSAIALGAGALCLTPSTKAQRPALATKGETTFSRYVPASARLFFTIRNLGEADETLRRAHAWRLLSLLTGRFGRDNGPFHLKAAITTFVGPDGSLDVKELMGAEVGIVTASWSELSRGVWFVRVPDEAAVDRWFPKKRRRWEHRFRSVNLFGTNDGLIVGMRDGIMAMGRRWTGDTLLLRTVRLMSGPAGAVLAESATFQKLKSHLPARPLAMAYVASAGATQSTQTGSPGLWPAIDRAVIGVYEGDGRIDFAIRGSLSAPSFARGRLAPYAVERMLDLPRTTVLAAAATIDFERVYEAASRTSSSEIITRCVTLLSGLRSSTPAGTEPLPRLGPHVIIAWGQDVSGGSTPQVALMVECGNARRLRDEATQTARNIIKLISAIETESASTSLRIERSMHLGVPVLHVPLRSYAAKSRYPFARLLGDTDPSWAAWGDWFIVTLGGEHLERLLDAQFGLVPTLATLPDARALRQRRTTALSLIQASLASNVLDQWLGNSQAGAASLFDPAWWERLLGPEVVRRRLGIGMKTEQEPGAVVVARVYPNTAAGGRLQPGDRILGIDGHLLDLTSPNADLRKRWAESTARPGPTLRVLRGSVAVDVLLPTDGDGGQLPSLPVVPVDALREFAALGRSIPFASVAVHASDEKHYSARLTLRLSPARTP